MIGIPVLRQHATVHLETFIYSTVSWEKSACIFLLTILSAFPFLCSNSVVRLRALVVQLTLTTSFRKSIFAERLRLISYGSGQNGLGLTRVKSLC